MIHLFQQGGDRELPTLLLLHGTGGDERDLLPLAQFVSPSSSVLSVKGNVLENGMPRFFQRLAEGVFDEEDLVLRTAELKQFVDEAAVRYGFDRGRVVAVGYSNGANIAGSLLLHHERALAGAVLHHPMVPRRGVTPPSLSGVPIFVGAGRNDPICRPEETEELAALLRSAGAAVDIHWEQTGHQLTQTEAAAVAAWFNRTFIG